MNRSRIQTVVNRLLSLPDPGRFNMGRWFHPCGSAACLAGHCVEWFPEEMWTVGSLSRCSPAHRLTGRLCEYSIADLLGISEGDAGRLCYPKLRVESRIYSCGRPSAREVAGVLRDMLEHGRLRSLEERLEPPAHEERLVSSVPLARRRRPTPHRRRREVPACSE